MLVRQAAHHAPEPNDDQDGLAGATPDRGEVQN